MSTTKTLLYNHPKYLSAYPTNRLEVKDKCRLWRASLGNTNKLLGIVAEGVQNTDLEGYSGGLTDGDISKWTAIVSSPSPAKVKFPLTAEQYFYLKELEVFMLNPDSEETITFYGRASAGDLYQVLFENVAQAEHLRLFCDQPEGIYIQELYMEITNGESWISEVRAYATVYSTDLIRIIHSERLYGNTFTSFSETATKPANTQIKYIMLVNHQRKYWNGTKWENNGNIFRMDRANTAAEINAHMGTLNNTANAVTVGVEVLMQTTDETVTPDLTSITIGYN